MNEAEFYVYFCGGYQCDQPGTVPIRGAMDETLGHYCEDHFSDFARELTRFSNQNQERLEEVT